MGKMFYHKQERDISSLLKDVMFVRLSAFEIDFDWTFLLCLALFDGRVTHVLYVFI